jgi:hypothetical protein
MGPNMKLRTVHANDMKYYHGQHAIPVWFEIHEESDAGASTPTRRATETGVDNSTPRASGKDSTPDQSGTSDTRPSDVSSVELSDSEGKLDLPPEDVSLPTLTAYRQKQLLRTKDLVQQHAKKARQKITKAKTKEVLQKDVVVDILDIQGLLYPDTLNTNITPEVQLSKAAKLMDKAGGQPLTRSMRSRQPPDRYVASALHSIGQEKWFGQHTKEVWGALCSMSRPQACGL